MVMRTFILTLIKVDIYTAIICTLMHSHRGPMPPMLCESEYPTCKSFSLFFFFLYFVTRC